LAAVAAPGAHAWALPAGAMMSDELMDQMCGYEDLDMEDPSPTHSGPANAPQQPVQATNVAFADEDTLEELISRARVERQDAATPSSKGDESHLRSFFVHAEHVKKDDAASPEHKALFAGVPEINLQNVEAMQQALYALFRGDEPRFCLQLVHYVTSIRKRNKGHIGERFPLKTLDHKIRRLGTYISSEHAREVREGLAEPRDINLLDPKSPVWAQLVDAFRQQGRERGEDYEVRGRGAAGLLLAAAGAAAGGWRWWCRAPARHSARPRPGCAAAGSDHCRRRPQVTSTGAPSKATMEPASSSRSDSSAGERGQEAAQAASRPAGQQAQALG
jgi:hypothetical protein